MTKIYVAHPYNGNPQNKDKVEVIARELARNNPNVLHISPIHAIGYLYNDVDYMKGMEYCYELLKMCDGLLLCKGWENSRGCRLEKEYAEELGMEINYM